MAVAVRSESKYEVNTAIQKEGRRNFLVLEYGWEPGDQ